jgi:AraC-like DNA-binding protein
MYDTPRPPLSEFVAMFWYFKHDEVANARERVLPTGAVDLIIRLDSGRSADSGMFGPRTRSVVINTTSKFELLGVHFKLGGGFPFLQLPMDELQDIGVSIGDLWGKNDAQCLLEVLHEAATAEMKFRILERWLLKVARDRLQSHPAVTFAMRALCSGRFGSAASVAEKTGYSQRHFIELFRKEVGLTPKKFQRLSRFRKVIDAVQRQTEVDWTDVGLSLGYFDQAHLIHDFRDFSGLTPEQYMKLRTGYINHVRLSD